MSEAVDVAIVGAGPYGLSVAAHLRGAGVEFRQFGKALHPWQSAMPEGMFLKSQGFASNLADPGGTHTLAAFCRHTGRPYADYGLPVPLDTFVAYGLWFAAEFSPGLEEVLVTSVTPEGGWFRVGLADGTACHARKVVIATGIEHFAYVPAELAGLPATACTHSSAHMDLSVFRGQDVIVVGGGQSALESAALLHESGARARIVMREPHVVWNGPPLSPNRPLLRRMREPEAGLGSGWATWFYSTRPGLFRHLPPATRVHRARTALGPAGASWLRPRVEGVFPVLTGHALGWARPEAGGVRLSLVTRGSSRTELTADHVIAATGYRSDLRGLAFLGDALRAQLRTVAGTPVVGRDYQSSVPGLYFAGPGVAPSFGPVMRFVYGTAHAAPAMVRGLLGAAGHQAGVAVGVGR
jgi:FAD-dependent urate hydroxylase